MDEHKIISDTISRRAEKLIARIPQGVLDNFSTIFLAGNSLNGVRGDLDLFPQYPEAFPGNIWAQFKTVSEDWKLVSSTKNAQRDSKVNL